MIDRAALRDLWLQVWPERLAALKDLEGSLDGPEPEWLPRVWTVEDGFAVADPQLGAEGVWMLEIGVLPERRRQGLGQRLYAEAVASLPGAPRLLVRVAEGDEPSLAFAERCGFERRKLDFPSSLDPRTVDPALLDAWLPTEAEIVPMAELDSEPFRRALHALFETVRVDIPRASPPAPIPFEQFDAHVLSDPFFCWEGSFAARDDTDLVGLSGVYRAAEPNVLDQWLLAVRRDRRGRGLARALKARGIAWARENAIEKIRTDNDSRNAPMLSINDRIGFVRERGLWSLEKASL